MFGTSRSLQALVKVSSEVEFYIYSQDWAEMKRCNNWHFQVVEEVTVWCCDTQMQMFELHKV